jgi:hypothetical protein
LATVEPPLLNVKLLPEQMVKEFCPLIVEIPAVGLPVHETVDQVNITCPLLPAAPPPPTELVVTVEPPMM